MKRAITLLLALLLVLQLAACGGGTETPAQTEAPAVGTGTEQPAGEPAVEPAVETVPPHQTYVYEEAGLTIAVPLSLPAEPEKLDDGILFRDPEGEWTVRFEPMSVSDTPHRLNNSTVAVQRILDFGYYQDVQIEDLSLGGYSGKKLSFSRNPNWVEKEQGYTSFYTEPHCLMILDYEDVVIANYGGLFIDISAPEESRGKIAPILDDPDVKLLTEYLEFAAPTAEMLNSIPGLSASFPIRWNVGNDGKQTLWGSCSGDPKGTIFLTSSIYADPAEAAGVVSENYRTLDFGGRSWYAAADHVQLSTSDYFMLQLFTEFTQYHALQAKITAVDKDEAGLWALLETEPFRTVLESVQTDPASFHDPEKDRMDASGFECNNINEISAYTGSDTDLVIPAVIGENQIVGVNTNLFKGNTSLRSVRLEEGIQYIEVSAFENCSALETVVLPSSLTYIDSDAFAGCANLRSVTFGDGLRVIESEAFEDCAALGDVFLPESMTKIGNAAFHGAGDGSGSFRCLADGAVYGTGALSETRFDSVEIGPNADLSARSILSQAWVNRVSIGEGCRELGESFLYAPGAADAEGYWIFSDAPLSLSMSGVEKIGDNAFYGRLGLQAVDLSGCRELGRSAFYSTGLVSITVPGTVKEVPESCFSNCPKVMTITLEEGVETVGPWAFSECGRAYVKGWYLTYLTEEEAAACGEKAVPNGSPDFDRAIRIFLPSTLISADDMSFSLMFIDGLYMLWCTEPELMPAFHVDAFYRCPYVHQIYFTKETIDQYGDTLDNMLNELTDVGTPAWYDTGDTKAYWSLEPLR